MTTPEIILSLFCMVGFALMFWGIIDREKRHQINNFSQLPDGSYYFGVNMTEYDAAKKKVDETVEELNAYHDLMVASEQFLHARTDDNLLELFRAKEKVKSFITEM